MLKSFAQCTAATLFLAMAAPTKRQRRAVRNDLAPSEVTSGLRTLAATRNMNFSMLADVCKILREMPELADTSMAATGAISSGGPTGAALRGLRRHPPQASQLEEEPETPTS